jgi:hypothetical protein
MGRKVPITPAWGKASHGLGEGEKAGEKIAANERAAVKFIPAPPRASYDRGVILGRVSRVCCVSKNEPFADARDEPEHDDERGFVSRWS